MIGQKFGRYTIVSRAESSYGHIRWTCACECGKIKAVSQSDLLRGHIKSCGCYSADAARIRMTTHGMKHNKIYIVWQNMKNRCNNVNTKDWQHYGGRGITVCDRWLESFENFYSDMGDLPFPKAEIDRIDNSQGYSPTNCRWVTHKENMINTRANEIITFRGESMTMREWADRLNVKPTALAARKFLGWDTDRILSTPVRVRNMHKAITGDLFTPQPQSR